MEGFHKRPNKDATNGWLSGHKKLAEGHTYRQVWSELSLCGSRLLGCCVQSEGGAQSEVETPGLRGKSIENHLFPHSLASFVLTQNIPCIAP